MQVALSSISQYLKRGNCRQQKEHKGESTDNKDCSENHDKHEDKHSDEIVANGALYDWVKRDDNSDNENIADGACHNRDERDRACNDRDKTSDNSNKGNTADADYKDGDDSSDNENTADEDNDDSNKGDYSSTGESTADADCNDRDERSDSSDDERSDISDDERSDISDDESTADPDYDDRDKGDDSSGSENTADEDNDESNKGHDRSTGESTADADYDDRDESSDSSDDESTAGPDFDDRDHGDDNSDDENTADEESNERGNSSDESSADEGSDEALTVTMSKKKHGKRVVDKKHVYFFCEAKQTHIARHLSLVHSEEKEVAKLLLLPKGSRSRRNQFMLLVNKGDRAHNYSVLEEGKGSLIPRWLPPSHKQVEDYLFCNFCSGLYVRSEHQRTCIFKTPPSSSGTGRQQVQSSARYLMPVPKDVNQNFLQIVCDMKQDEIAAEVRKDSLILKYGQQLFKKQSKVVGKRDNENVYDGSRNDYIRQKMRELGRLKIQGKKLGLMCLDDFVIPKNFEKVVKAVEEVAQLDVDAQSHGIPSLAKKLGHSLLNVSNIALCQAPIQQNEEKVKLVEQFQVVYKTMWNSEVSSTALTTLEETKWNKPSTVPCAKDIQILIGYLSDQMQKGKLI